ncbi:MAG: hypothetical protein ACOYWZ_00065 [Bacillota bacterium]
MSEIEVPVTLQLTVRDIAVQIEREVKKLAKVSPFSEETSKQTAKKVGKEVQTAMGGALEHALRAFRYYKGYPFIAEMIKSIENVFKEPRKLLVETVGEVGIEKMEAAYKPGKLEKEDLGSITKETDTTLQKIAIINKGSSNTLNSIVGTLSGVIGSVNALTIGLLAISSIFLKGIGEMMGGFFEAFQPLYNVLRTIGKLVGMIVASVVNLLVPFLMLIAYLLVPILKIMNFIFRPIFLILMKGMQGTVKLLNDLISTILKGGGDLGVILGSIIKVIIDTLAPFFAAFLSVITPIIQGVLGWLGQAIYDFLTMNVEEVTKQIPILGGVIGFAIKAMQMLIGAILGFIVGLVGKESFADMGILTKEMTSNLTKVNAGFRLGEGIAKIMIQMAIAFGTLLGYFVDTIIPQIGAWIEKLKADPLGALWDLLVGTLKLIIDSFKALLLGTGKKFYKTTLEFEPTWMGEPPKLKEVTKEKEELTLGEIFEQQGLIGAVNKLAKDFTGIDIIGYWNGTLKPALDSLVKMITALATVFENWSKNINTNIIPNLERWVKSAINKLVETALPTYSVTKIAAKMITGKDMVISPTGTLISTHPEDYIIATRTPERLGGRNSSGEEVTINLTVNSSASNPRDLAREISKELQYALRNRSSYGY